MSLPVSKNAHMVVHFCSICGPKFCSMVITRDIQDRFGRARAPNVTADREAGMAEKVAEFAEMGGKKYSRAPVFGRALAKE